MALGEMEIVNLEDAKQAQFTRWANGFWTETMIKFMKSGKDAMRIQVKWAGQTSDLKLKYPAWEFFGRTIEGKKYVYVMRKSALDKKEK